MPRPVSLAATRASVAPEREMLFDADVTGLKFSTVGILGVALGDGTVEIVPPNDRAVTAAAHDGAILSLVLDADGSGFLTSGDDGRVVRTTADGACATVFEHAGRQIDVLAVSRQAAAIAVGVGKDVHLLDLDGVRLGIAANHASTVTAVAFNPRGKRLAVAHYGGVTLWWKTMIGRNPMRLDWRGSHIGVCWSPDGTHVVTMMQECELHGWRIETGKDMSMRGYAAKVRSIDWFTKPMILATAGADRVVAWPFVGTGPMGKPPLELGQGIGQLVTQVAAHPSRPLVAAGFDDGRVAVCEVTAAPAGGSMRLRPGDGKRVSALAWSPDGNKLAIGTDGGSVALFDCGGRGS